MPSESFTDQGRDQRLELPGRLTADPRNKYRAYFRAELEMAALYRALANRTRDHRRQRVLSQLAAWEVRHAGIWATKLGVPTPKSAPTRLAWRHQILLTVADLVGLRRILPLLLRGEAAEIRTYSKEPEAKEGKARDKNTRTSPKPGERSERNGHESR